jgi:DNA-binding transcriptional MerR regulator
LRHYQQVGLLDPARTDPSSGYRYYRAEQVAEARLIRRLRDLDLPVDEVRAVLAAPDDSSRNAVIAEHLERMSRQLEQVQETVDSLRRLLTGEGVDLPVSHRDEPATMVLAIRGRVDGDTAVTWWLESFTELHRLLRTADLTRTGPDGADFPIEFFTEGAAELVAFVPVEGVPALGQLSAAGGVEAMMRPAARYAVAVHEGPMVDLDGAYSAVGKAVVERAMSSDGPVVERYLPLGGQGADDLLAHHTEVCWPVTG